MKSKKIVIALMVIALMTAAAGILGAVVLSIPGRGDVPMSRPSAAELSSTSGATTSPAPSAPLSDIAGMPIHITVRHGNEVLIDASIVPITLDADGVLAPPPGEAGVYYSRSDWNTIPGNLDRYRGIIAGHDVTGNGTKDVFYNLGAVREGDAISLIYSLDAGGTATAGFVATADAASVPKSDVVHASEYQYLWQSMKEPGRLLSILSCDLSQADPGQHSRNNWVVDAVRVG